MADTKKDVIFVEVQISFTKDDILIHQIGLSSCAQGWSKVFIVAKESQICPSRGSFAEREAIKACLLYIKNRTTEDQFKVLAFTSSHAIAIVVKKLKRYKLESDFLSSVDGFLNLDTFFQSNVAHNRHGEANLSSVFPSIYQEGFKLMDPKTPADTLAKAVNEYVVGRVLKTTNHTDVNIPQYLETVVATTNFVLGHKSFQDSTDLAIVVEPLNRNTSFNPGQVVSVNVECNFYINHYFNAIRFVPSLSASIGMRLVSFTKVCDTVVNVTMRCIYPTTLDLSPDQPSGLGVVCVIGEAALRVAWGIGRPHHLCLGPVRQYRLGTNLASLRSYAATPSSPKNLSGQSREPCVSSIQYKLIPLSLHREDKGPIPIPQGRIKQEPTNELRTEPKNDDASTIIEDEVPDGEGVKKKYPPLALLPGLTPLVTTFLSMDKGKDAGLQSAVNDIILNLPSLKIKDMDNLQSYFKSTIVFLETKEGWMEHVKKSNPLLPLFFERNLDLFLDIAHEFLRHNTFDSNEDNQSKGRNNEKCTDSWKMDISEEIQKEDEIDTTSDVRVAKQNAMKQSSSTKAKTKNLSQKKSTARLRGPSKKKKNHLIRSRQARQAAKLIVPKLTSTESKKTSSVQTGRKSEKKYSCPHCDFEAEKKGHLSVHVQGFHLKKHIFECPHCDYKTPYNILKSHIQRRHKSLA